MIYFRNLLYRFSVRTEAKAIEAATSLTNRQGRRRKFPYRFYRQRYITGFKHNY